MKSRRHHGMRKRNKNKTRKHVGGKGKKKWTTAIQAAQSTLSKTGSLSKAKKALKVQALANARKLFGSIGQSI
jgi:hypothetical protein